MLSTCPHKCDDLFAKGRPSVFMSIMHVKDSELSVIRAGHCVMFKVWLFHFYWLGVGVGAGWGLDAYPLSNLFPRHSGEANLFSILYDFVQITGQKQTFLEQNIGSKLLFRQFCCPPPIHIP